MTWHNIPITYPLAVMLKSSLHFLVSPQPNKLHSAHCRSNSVILKAHEDDESSLQYSNYSGWAPYMLALYLARRLIASPAQVWFAVQAQFETLN